MQGTFSPRLHPLLLSPSPLPLIPSTACLPFPPPLPFPIWIRIYTHACSPVCVYDQRQSNVKATPHSFGCSLGVLLKKKKDQLLVQICLFR